MREAKEKRDKIKNTKCANVRCVNCPLKSKMCQRFVGNREHTIGVIIEKMFNAQELSWEEYKNVKLQANEPYGSK